MAHIIITRASRLGLRSEPLFSYKPYVAEPLRLLNKTVSDRSDALQKPYAKSR